MGTEFAPSSICIDAPRAPIKRPSKAAKITCRRGRKYFLPIGVRRVAAPFLSAKTWAALESLDATRRRMVRCFIRPRVEIGQVNPAADQSSPT